VARRATAGVVALMAACCVLGPAALVGGFGAALGSAFGIVAAVGLAVACVVALLIWRRRGQRGVC